MSKVVLGMYDVHKGFSQGENRLDILKGVNLEIKEGESVALIGQSGTGKSTLLQVAGLLDKCDAGQVVIHEQECQSATDKVKTLIRRQHIGVVYQFHHLLAEFSALENVIIPQRIAGVSYEEAKSNASDILGYLKLGDRLSHRPSQLSGGEQQRVAIARAVVNRPSILLADEPTGNLDPQTAKDVFNLLLKTAKGIGLGLLVVTHNTQLAAKMDRVVSLRDGKIIRKAKQSL